MLCTPLSYFTCFTRGISKTFGGCVRLTQLSERSIYSLNASPAGCTPLNKKKPGAACQPHRASQTLGLNPLSLGLSVSVRAVPVKHRSLFCSSPFPLQLGRARG